MDFVEFLDYCAYVEVHDKERGAKNEDYEIYSGPWVVIALWSFFRFSGVDRDYHIIRPHF